MNYNEQTLAEIARTNPQAILVFEKTGLDYCCNGDRNFQKACEQAGLNPQSILDQIDLHTTDASVPNPANLPLDTLVDYIYDHHHQYLERVTPTILLLLDKVCHRHGLHHPELHELKALFQTSAGELAVHMKKEEMMLFPFIKKLVRAKADNGVALSKHFGSVENPIHVMEDDHDHEGEALKNMAAITNDFFTPPGACNSFASLYALLSEYVRDTYRHIHLENNVLFPGAVALERELQQTP